MKNEFRLKKLNNEENNELEVFVNTIYNEIFNKIDNLNQEIKLENEPLHHLLLVTRLKETRDTLRMFERIVEDATEYVEIEEENETIKN